MVEKEQDRFTRVADHTYRLVENVVYALVALLLIVAAGALLVSAAAEFVTGIADGARETVEHVLDALLLVLWILVVGEEAHGGLLSGWWRPDGGPSRRCR